VARISFLPTDRRFFDLFERGSVNLVEAARLLVDMLETWQDVEAKASSITDLEHVGDTITHEVIAHLHRTFVTPLDREDISALAQALDDVIDFIQAASDAMVLYRVSAPTPRARELAQTILEASQEIERAMPLLRRPRDLKDVLSCCIELNRLENDADRVYRAALGELFADSADFTFIIQWREIYQHMESATDRCEDVANVLEGVALKYA
jgi:hypothetical protein